MRSPTEPWAALCAEPRLRGDRGRARVRGGRVAQRPVRQPLQGEDARSLAHMFAFRPLVSPSPVGPEHARRTRGLPQSGRGTRLPLPTIYKHV